MSAVHALVLLVALGAATPASAEEPIVHPSGPVVLPVSGLAVDLPKQVSRSYQIYGTLATDELTLTRDSIDVKDPKRLHVAGYDVAILPLTQDCMKLARKFRAFDGASPGRTLQTPAGAWSIDISTDFGPGFVPFGAKGRHAISVGLCAGDGLLKLLVSLTTGYTSDDPERVAALVAKDPVIAAIRKAFDARAAGATKPVGSIAVRQPGDYAPLQDTFFTGGMRIARPDDGEMWIAVPDDKLVLARIAPALPHAEVVVQLAPGLTCEAALPSLQRGDDGRPLVVGGWSFIEPRDDATGTAHGVFCRSSHADAIVVDLYVSDLGPGGSKKKDTFAFATKWLANIEAAIAARPAPPDPNAPPEPVRFESTTLPVTRPTPPKRIIP